MTDPSGVPLEQNDSENTENSETRYLVKTPWHTSVLHHPEGLFPDVTPQGVEMSAEERDEAKAAAKQARIKLLTKEV